MQEEKWLPIYGFEGLYEVSSHGRVRSLTRVVERTNGTVQTWDSRILKPSNSRKYVNVSLCKDGKIFYRGVHRLVAIAFIDRVAGKNCVNHIDADPSNNCVHNLEWVTHKENTAHAMALGNLTYTKRYKPVFQLTMDGILVRKWNSASCCVEDGFHKSAISRCCIGTQYSHKGFRWKFGTA